MKIPITFFAPAERLPIEVVHRQAGGLLGSPIASTLRKPASNYLFVLNPQRQIVMASENVLDLMPDKTLDQIVGLRPGEALNCVHADDCDSGCGTSRFCRDCGMVKVILSGLRGCRDIAECRLTRLSKGLATTMELQVLATPLLHNQDQFTLLTVAVISPPSP